MKFDLFKWQEVQANETYQGTQGRLRIVCSQVGALYLQAEGVEVLAGVGTSFDLTTHYPVEYRVEAPEGTRVFIEAPVPPAYTSNGEIFTNFDKRPVVSAAAQEVTAALRQFKIEQAAIRRQMRQERLDWQASRRTKKEETPEPEVKPDPEPDPNAGE